MRIDSLQAEKTNQQIPTEDLFFDVNAKLEEQKKTGEQVDLNFNISISTKPNVAKYTVAGTVSLVGKQADVKKRLEVNPKTNIPQILFTVYQHVFNSIYMIASILNAPYPPPDLLHPMAEKIQIFQDKPQENTTETPSPEASTAEAASAAATVSASG